MKSSDVIEKLAATEGIVAVRNGILRFEDGSTIDLRNINDVQSSVRVTHWQRHFALSKEKGKDGLDHQIDIADQRITNGQVYVDVGPSEGKADDFMGVIVEVGSYPLETLEGDAPCVHIHFDGDNLAASLYKVGERILMRTESGVSVEPFRVIQNKRKETMYWIE